jgi:hypothetical protein
MHFLHAAHVHWKWTLLEKFYSNHDTWPTRWRQAYQTSEPRKARTSTSFLEMVMLRPALRKSCSDICGAGEIRHCWLEQMAVAQLCR